MRCSWGWLISGLLSTSCTSGCLSCILVAVYNLSQLVACLLHCLDSRLDSLDVVAFKCGLAFKCEGKPAFEETPSR